MSTKEERNYIAFPLERVKGIIPPLKEADIVLVHVKKNFLRYLIRKVTKSYWDHVALVLFAKDVAKGQYYNQIIEAVAPRGIEVHKLDKYLKDPEKYEIGIKRVPDLDPETRKRILSFMLMNVDAPYYKLTLSRFLLAAISKKFSEDLLGRQRFSCSGFVQKAFYEAAGWDKREDMIFREDFLSPMELQDITTPADIAQSGKAVWIYNKKLI
ncbi:MAG: YiiX/YebB-like N1pC/P60 family cysteine hydrolase [Patescibacteria group bacterium]